MQIFLFIVLLFAVGLMRSLPKVITKWGKEDNDVSTIILALILSIGFQFVLPFVLNWYLNFLFNFVLNYWVAFGLLFVVSVFVEHIDVNE
jgi:uncharacterized membrane protein YoaK (UPF0700 family)